MTNNENELNISKLSFDQLVKMGEGAFSELESAREEGDSINGNTARKSCENILVELLNRRLREFGVQAGNLDHLLGKQEVDNE